MDAMTTTTRQIDEAADLRGVLLAALGMGEWEAEHLSGLALARRLAADAPRYRAIGNSMAVPVMRAIGERIAEGGVRWR